MKESSKRHLPDTDWSSAAGLESCPRKKLAKPRILIVGCGDVGLRMLPLLTPRYRVFALTSQPERHATLRAAGAIPIPGDLDRPESLHRLAGLAPTVLHLAPPPNHGAIDSRTRDLLPRLGRVERLVYVSTTGVYGDCGGARFDETRPVHPQTARAVRRVDAEARLRAWARGQGTRLAILRVPGIYAADRLPLARLRAGTPALIDAEDVYTNHIHADDLARIVIAAMHHAAPLRVYHAVDDGALKMGTWFDLVADAYELPRPQRMSRVDLQEKISQQLLSFMSESRQLLNARARSELGILLDYPTVMEYFNQQ